VLHGETSPTTRLKTKLKPDSSMNSISKLCWTLSIVSRIFDKVHTVANISIVAEDLKVPGSIPTTEINPDT
jgi:hypothetical protein